MKYKYILAFCALFMFISCANESKQITQLETTFTKNTHNWYFFNNNDIQGIDDVKDVPSQTFKAWTEAVRISSASSAKGDGNSIPNGYALVNRLGMLVFSDKDFTLYQDQNVFANRSADNIVFQDDTPIFSLYKSTFFNNSFGNNPNKNIHHFLIQFDTVQNIFYPLITCDNLSIAEKSEITDFVWDGKTFICSVKNSGDEKTTFDYISVKPKLSLLSLNSATAKKNIDVQETDVDSFRSLIMPSTIQNAPPRLKELLLLISEKTPFFVSCYTVGSHSPRNYTNQTNSNSSPLLANALLSDTYACVMFRDGTTYITGSLYGKYVLNKGKPIAFRLPKLPENHEYSSFSISGTNMYVAWEQQEFYKTGKSGFLVVDLDVVLYNSIAGVF